MQAFGIENQKRKIMKVAILYICTGKYKVFWKNFFLSFEKKFLPHIRKEYFVFTDAKRIAFENKTGRIHKIYHKKREWPYDTLYRYDMFLEIEERLKDFDYLYFMNANLLCNKVIKKEDILPQGSNQLVAVLHSGYEKKPPKWLPYDRNPKSLAYVPYGKEGQYICGGINGGTARAFLEMSKKISAEINQNSKAGIIAPWHDESHINHYILGRNDVRILSSDYCYREGHEGKNKKKAEIIARDKRKYFMVNVFKMKNTEDMLKNLNIWMKWKLFRK